MKSLAAATRYTPLAVLFTLFASVAVGIVRYRGPAPRGLDSPSQHASAARMRETLVELLGEPAEKHTTGTASGEAFLLRLENKLQSFGVTMRRIQIPFDADRQEWHPKGRIDLLPPDTVLQNLLVTVPGSQPELAPILVATHHDSCRWGPGAGDAGSAVVALVEHIRWTSTTQPQRTTLYLFTDGEEYGLLGAYAIAARDELPFQRPFFVLNYDARGTTGGVPMFETHSGNRVWVDALINDLARPKITSSLAVTVYRLLPNATDFNAWHGSLGLPGFNYATIGGAHRYHRPDDRPENVSDRTLQHMGDHLFSMHHAVDSLGRETLDRIRADADSNRAANSVFFDVFGVGVIHFGELTQKLFALIALVLLTLTSFLSKQRGQWRMIGWRLILVLVAIALGLSIGGVVHVLLKTTPWSGLRYTPVDHLAGLATVGLAFVLSALSLDWLIRRRGDHSDPMAADITWLGTSALGAMLAFVLPGGAYLLVVPSVVYVGVRISTGRTAHSSWAAWICMAILVGPLLSLLVQALGPWRQPVYGVIAALLSVLAVTVWHAKDRAA